MNSARGWMVLCVALLVGCQQAELPPQLSVNISPPQLTVSATQVQVGAPVDLTITGSVTVQATRPASVRYESELQLCALAGMRDADDARVVICKLIRNTPEPNIQVQGQLQEVPMQVTAVSGEARAFSHSARLTFLKPGTYTLYGYHDVSLEVSDTERTAGGGQVTVPQAVYVTVSAP